MKDETTKLPWKAPKLTRLSAKLAEAGNVAAIADNIGNNKS